MPLWTQGGNFGITLKTKYICYAVIKKVINSSVNNKNQIHPIINFTQRVRQYTRTHTYHSNYTQPTKPNWCVVPLLQTLYTSAYYLNKEGRALGICVRCIIELCYQHIPHTSILHKGEHVITGYLKMHSHCSECWHLHPYLTALSHTPCAPSPKPSSVQSLHPVMIRAGSTSNVKYSTITHYPSFYKTNNE